MGLTKRDIKKIKDDAFAEAVEELKEENAKDFEVLKKLNKLEV